MALTQRKLDKLGDQVQEQQKVFEAKIRKSVKDGNDKSSKRIDKLEKKLHGGSSTSPPILSATQHKSDKVVSFAVPTAVSRQKSD